MKSIPPRVSFPLVGVRLAAAIALGVLPVLSVRAEPASPNLVANGNLETPNATGEWAANWTKPKAGQFSWQAEGADHFIRMQAVEPGKMMMIYHQVGLGAAKAVEVTVRARVTGLARGAQAWFDARVMTSFRDAASAEMKGGGGKAIAFGKDTAGWVERKVAMPVPAGAVFLAIMPALFNVEAGTLDITEVSVKAIDPASLAAPAAK